MINRTQNHCCHAVRYGRRALLVACLCAATLRADESKSLKVSLGETRTVSESLGIHWFPGLSRMLDGSLHVHIGVYPDAVRKSVADIIAITLRSTDLGRIGDFFESTGLRMAMGGSWNTWLCATEPFWSFLSS